MNRRSFVGALSPLALAARTIAFPTHAAAQATPAVISETIEWTWAVRPPALNPGQPNILLVGDSITRAYYPEVVKLLEGNANCYLFATSAASGDPRLTHQLEELATLYPIPFRAIHFNNGMHGWAYTEDRYAAALPALLKSIKRLSPDAALIWASTTPVRKDSTTGGATNPRIKARNRTAASLMLSNHIPIDDQHALMLAHQDLHSDDVHFTPPGAHLQAIQVAASLQPSLATAAKPA